MAETRLANVIVPEVFTGYTLEPSIYRSRFWRSNVIEVTPALTALLNGGGETFNLPFWQDIADDADGVPSETVAATVDNITTNRQSARRQFREKAWGQNAISEVFAGSSGLQTVQGRIVDYWARRYNLMAVATLNGVLADNIANDSGDLVNDISAATPATDQNFSDEGVINAQALLGENGTVGRPDQTDFAAILVHPQVYSYMRNQDLIDFVPISGQDRPLEFYLRMEVLVDSSAPVSSGVYDTFIFKPGCLQFGVGTTGYIPTETDRVPLTGFGIDQLITRRVVAMHVVGTRWLEASVGGVSPTNAELALAANYDRVFQQQNMRFAVLRHRINVT